MSERLVLCGGARRAGVNSALRLALDGSLQNITLKLEDISKRLVRNVPDLLVDLVEIATYVYCADQATSRGGDAQVGMGADLAPQLSIRHSSEKSRLLESQDNFGAATGYTFFHIRGRIRLRVRGSGRSHSISQILGFQRGRRCGVQRR